MEIISHFLLFLFSFYIQIIKFNYIIYFKMYDKQCYLHVQVQELFMFYAFYRLEGSAMSQPRPVYSSILNEPVLTAAVSGRKRNKKVDETKKEKDK